MCALFHHPLFGSGEKRQCELQLGADALATMHDYVVTMMFYVQALCCAIAGICVIVSGFQIYVKINTGEDGITKSVVTLVGACLFLIGAFLVFPAFSAIAYRNGMQE